MPRLCTQPRRRFGDLEWLSLSVLLILAASCGSSDWPAPDLGSDLARQNLPLRLDEITPALGPTTGGTLLSISGQGFAVGAQVFFDGEPASGVTVWSGTRLSVVLPKRPGPPGPVPVVIRNPSGDQITRSDRFRYRLTQLPFSESIFSGMPKPMRLVLGDLNSDRRPDMAIPSSNGKVSFLLSNAEGGFGLSPTYSLGSMLAAAQAADLDGDQNLDLLLTSPDTNEVHALLGDGRGGFSVHSTAAGAKPTALALGDFNSDHHLDVVVTNPESDGVSLLLGDGRGGLAMPVAFPAGLTPASLLVTDVDRDTHLDVVLASTTGRAVTVLRGDGRAGFAAQPLLPMANSPDALAAGDVTGDGVLDLAVVSTADSIVSLLVGDGRGGFSAAASYPVGAQPTAVLLRDISDDGIPDLIVGHLAVRAGILLGQGEGRFSPISYQGSNPYSTSSSLIAMEDLDGDTQAELIYVDSSGVQVLRGNARSGWGRPPPLPFPEVGNTRYEGSALGDFDRDGRLDIAVTNLAAGSVSVLSGDGQGGFAVLGTSVLGTSYYSLAAFDWNQDGSLDLAALGSAGVQILVGDGRGTFIAAPGPPLAAPSRVRVAVADLNRDGIPDLVVGSAIAYVYQGQGPGLPPVLRKQLGSGYSNGSFTSGDFNGDGHLDLVTAYSDNPDTEILLHVGDGQFGYTTHKIAGLPIEVYPSRLEAADLNGDGIDDLAIGSYRFGGMVLLGTRDAKFGSAIAPFSPGKDGTDLVIGDWNGDAQLDVLFGYPSSKVIHWGNGRGGFPSSTNILSLGFSLSADLNGDQKPDLITAAEGSLSVLLNTSP